MRAAILIAALLLAACDAGPEWVNRQAELANDLEPPAPAEEINAAAPAANDLNAAAPAENEVNTAAPAENEAAPPPEGD